MAYQVVIMSQQKIERRELKFDMGDHERNFKPQKIPSSRLIHATCNNKNQTIPLSIHDQIIITKILKNKFPVFHIPDNTIKHTAFFGNFSTVYSFNLMLWKYFS